MPALVLFIISVSNIDGFKLHGGLHANYFPPCTGGGGGVILLTTKFYSLSVQNGSDHYILSIPLFKLLNTILYFH